VRLDSNLVGILCRRDVGDEALLLSVEVYEHKGDKHEDADHTVAAESCFRAKVGDKQAWKRTKKD
jgi:hypothetical protein